MVSVVACKENVRTATPFEPPRPIGGREIEKLVELKLVAEDAYAFVGWL